MAGRSEQGDGGGLGDRWPLVLEKSRETELLLGGETKIHGVNVKTKPRMCVTSANRRKEVPPTERRKTVGPSYGGRGSRSSQRISLPFASK